MTQTAVPDAPPIRWRKTTYPDPEDLRCDRCGEQADTMHLLPTVTNCETVVMACPDHCPIPQGYMVRIDRWYGEMFDAHSFADHLAEKVNGGMAVAMIEDRIAEFSVLPDDVPHSPALLREAAYKLNTLWQIEAERGLCDSLGSSEYERVSLAPRLRAMAAAMASA